MRFSSTMVLTLQLEYRMTYLVVHLLLDQHIIATLQLQLSHLLSSLSLQFFQLFFLILHQPLSVANLDFYQGVLTCKLGMLLSMLSLVKFLLYTIFLSFPQKLYVSQHLYYHNYSKQEFCANHRHPIQMAPNHLLF